MIERERERENEQVGVKERQGLRGHVYIDPRACVCVYVFLFFGFYRKVSSCQNSSVNKSVLVYK